MKKPLSIDEFRDLFNKKLASALKPETAKLAAISTPAKAMAEAFTKNVLAQNKRNRPYLFYLAYSGYGGKFKDFPWQIAYVIELYHQQLLIHDDVMDHDFLRHGEVNISGHFLKSLEPRIKDKQQLRETAEAMGILGGDYALSLLGEMIATEPTLSGDHKLELIRSLHEINRHEVAGQQLDILVTSSDRSALSVREICKIYVHKTSHYTFLLPLRWAAMVTGHEKEFKLIKEFSYAAGIVYQITDDLISIKSDSKVTGKPTGNDLREDKRTVVTQLAYQHLPRAEWLKLRRILGRTVTGQKLRKAQRILNEYGIVTTAELTAAHYAKKAFKQLGMTKISNEAKNELTDLVQALITRTE